MNLCDLPDVPLRIIAAHLPFEDALNFSQLMPQWNHLQPIIECIKGPDFDIDGPETGHEGHHVEEGR